MVFIATRFILELPLMLHLSSNAVKWADHIVEWPFTIRTFIPRHKFNMTCHSCTFLKVLFIVFLLSK